jgi:hypothetical protein
MSNPMSVQGPSISKTETRDPRAKQFLNRLRSKSGTFVISYIANTFFFCYGILLSLSIAANGLAPVLFTAVFFSGLYLLFAPMVAVVYRGGKYAWLFLGWIPAGCILFLVSMIGLVISA